ncbi:uncharacterized protein KY384_008269 [Bacidia gigantensis]|uniref:uncharacterized protein n=1 Tax=Bacidia gigantensis TaxID=2732470 RepID=UPI001D0461F7|nr:uncharacterized protein KY384_008269 [Bacidia gigantensis]KAG8526840.1 hypothetical protein KY384_008269 [Bacidia gigantensis]
MAYLQGKPDREGEEPLVAWLCDKYGDGPLKTIDGPRDPATNKLIVPSRDFVEGNFRMTHSPNGTYAEMVIPQDHGDASHAPPLKRRIPAARSPPQGTPNRVREIYSLQGERSNWQARQQHHSPSKSVVQSYKYAPHSQYESPTTVAHFDQSLVKHRQRPNTSARPSGSRPSSAAASSRQLRSSSVNQPRPLRRSQPRGMSGSSTRAINPQASDVVTNSFTSAKVIEAALENVQDKSCIKFRSLFSKNGAKELVDYLEGRVHLGKNDFNFVQQRAERGRTKVIVEIASRSLAKEVLQELHNSFIGGGKIKVVSNLTNNSSFDSAAQASSPTRTDKKTRIEPTICNGS